MKLSKTKYTVYSGCPGGTASPRVSTSTGALPTNSTEKRSKLSYKIAAKRRNNLGGAGPDGKRSHGGDVLVVVTFDLGSR